MSLVVNSCTNMGLFNIHFSLSHLLKRTLTVLSFKHELLLISWLYSYFIYMIKTVGQSPLQCCSFCCTTTWINYMYTYAPSLPKTQLLTASPLNCPRGWCQFHPSHCWGQELLNHLWFLFLLNPTSTLSGNPVGSTIKIYADSQSFLIDFWLYPAFSQAITVSLWHVSHITLLLFSESCNGPSI